MSLAVWLPLNGDLHNQGLNPLSVAQVQSGVNLDNTGKVGKCYTNSGTSVNIATPCTFSAKTFSVCAWIRLNTRRNNWCRGFGMSGNGTYFGFGCEHTNGNGLGFHYYKTIDGTNTAIFDSYPVNISTGSWNHFAMCYDGVKYYIYQNGKLIKSGNANRSNIDCNMTTLYLFGGAANRYSQCSLNDIRIYDHCLSVKEVEEISKGLVLHYKLDNNGIGNENLITNSLFLSSYSPWFGVNGSSLSITTIDNKKCLTAIKGTSNNLFGYSQPNYIAGEKQTFTMSGDIYTDTTTTWTLGVMLSTSQASGWQGMSVSTNPHNNNLSVGWNHISVTFTAQHNSYSGNMQIFFGTPHTSFYLYHPKLEKGTIETPYCPSSYELGNNSSIIYDSSGYSHNGTIVGSLETITPSPRYSCATQFDNKEYIIHKLPENMHQATYSFWVKASSYTGYGAIYMPYQSPSAGTSPWFAINTESCKVWAFFGNNSPNYTKGSGTMPLNEWHHCVYVWDNGVAQWYVDGEKNGNSVTYTTRTFIQNTANATIGNSYTGTNWNGTPFNGQLSDFRIYATALTAAQVKELYTTSMSIDSSGNVHARELVEL